MSSSRKATGPNTTVGNSAALQTLCKTYNPKSHRGFTADFNQFSCRHRQPTAKQFFRGIRYLLTSIQASRPYFVPFRAKRRSLIKPAPASAQNRRFLALFSTPGGGCRTYRVSCKPMDAPQSNVHVKTLQILDRFHPSCKIRLISALGQTYLPSDSNERKTESSQTCGLKVSSVMNRELPKGNTWFTNTEHSGVMSYSLGRQPRISYLWGVIGVQDQRLGNR
ncbi:hypothetical protein KL909_000055 [Ogataea angusta]|nr:hypothetical protein KL909_000055 [Ogataea angusta]